MSINSLWLSGVLGVANYVSLSYVQTWKLLLFNNCHDQNIQLTTLHTLANTWGDGPVSVHVLQLRQRISCSFIETVASQR
jgi:hypothetical protein